MRLTLLFLVLGLLACGAQNSSVEEPQADPSSVEPARSPVAPAASVDSPFHQVASAQFSQLSRGNAVLDGHEIMAENIVWTEWCTVCESGDHSTENLTRAAFTDRILEYAQGAEPCQVAASAELCWLDFSLGSGVEVEILPSVESVIRGPFHEDTPSELLCNASTRCCVIRGQMFSHATSTLMGFCHNAEGQITSLDVASG